MTGASSWRSRCSQIDEKRGDAARAARRLDEALGKDGDARGDARLILARAAVDERRGDWQRAIARAEQLLAREPRNVEALNFAGFVAADHGHDLPRALKRLQAAVALSPGSGAIIDSLGWAYFRAGDLARARRLPRAGRRASSPAIPRSSSTSAICTRSARSATARWRPTAARWRCQAQRSRGARAGRAHPHARSQERRRPMTSARQFDRPRPAKRASVERGRLARRSSVRLRGRVLRARAAGCARPYPAPTPDALIAALAARQQARCAA